MNSATYKIGVRPLFFVLTALGLAGCASAPELPVQPEPPTGFRAGVTTATATKHMAAAANPLATEAGRAILRQGGSAVDAAIAIQMVLTLVEPQSSGIGGGAFIMHWDGKRVQAFDGRETAPREADENLFIVDGKPMAFYDAAVGGRVDRRVAALVWLAVFAIGLLVAWLRERHRQSPRAGHVPA